MDEALKSRLDKFLWKLRNHVVSMEKNSSMAKLAEDMRKFRSMANEIEGISNDFFEDLQNHYGHCSKCEEYFPYKDFFPVVETKVCDNIIIDTLDFDEGIIRGDAVVEYTYNVCPKCGNKYQVNRKILQSFNFHIEEA